nr:hypothetical protein [Tanacetum cinerariifolium]
MTICLSSWGYNTEDDTSVKHQEVQDNRIEITLIDSSMDAKFQKTGSNLESIPKDELESLSRFKADKTDSDDHQCEHKDELSKTNEASTSGGFQILSVKLVCWSTKKQSSVAMSSAEAENVAATR